VIDYLTETEISLERFKQKTDLQSIDEKAKIEKQLTNVRKIIHELYDRREKKIIEMAINKARTASNIVDVSNLLNEEKKLFEEFVGLVQQGRESILLKLLSKALPSFEIKKVDDSEEKKEEDEKENQMVRFISAVPKFVSPELEVYGPFEPEDMASLPKKIAHVLVKKNRAELMGD
jgi:DNA replication initiation complex subunit (GINS family)